MDRAPIDPSGFDRAPMDHSQMDRAHVPPPVTVAGGGTWYSATTGGAGAGAPPPPPPPSQGAAIPVVPPPESGGRNTTKIVLLSVIATILALALIGIGVLLALRSGGSTKGSDTATEVTESTSDVEIDPTESTTDPSDEVAESTESAGTSTDVNGSSTTATDNTSKPTNSVRPIGTVTAQTLPPAATASGGRIDADKAADLVEAWTQNQITIGSFVDPYYGDGASLAEVRADQARDAGTYTNSVYAVERGTVGLIDSGSGRKTITAWMNFHRTRISDGIVICGRVQEVVTVEWQTNQWVLVGVDEIGPDTDPAASRAEGAACN